MTERAVEAALWALVERRRRRARKRSKAVEQRAEAVLEYLEKSRVATVGQLAKALGLSRMQARYIARLLGGRVCYKVVGKYAFVGRTCADVEERLRSEYAKMVETVRRLVDGCRSAVCCVRLRDVVSVLTRRDPPSGADMAFYMALLEEFPGGLSARRTKKVAVCTRRT